MKELLAVVSLWMADIFGKTLEFLEIFVQIYTPLTNTGECDTAKALKEHVDGGQHTGDLVAVVYAVHAGWQVSSTSPYCYIISLL